MCRRARPPSRCQYWHQESRHPGADPHLPPRTLVQLAGGRCCRGLPECHDALQRRAQCRHPGAELGQLSGRPRAAPGHHAAVEGIGRFGILRGNVKAGETRRHGTRLPPVAGRTAIGGTARAGRRNRPSPEGRLVQTRFNGMFPGKLPGGWAFAPRPGPRFIDGPIPETPAHERIRPKPP
jgi:hypothetical protein